MFGDDDHVEDTLGISFKKEENKGQETKKKPSKVDLLEDDVSIIIHIDTVHSEIKVSFYYMNM